MILKNKSDASEFVRMAERCKGEVYFEDSQGDRLNLKSTLAQFVFAIVLFKVEDLDYTIRFDAEDEAILLPYLRKGVNDNGAA